jgi:ferrous iron transport protein B
MEGNNSGTPFSEETNSALTGMQRLDREQAEAALQYSVAGRVGLYLEGVTGWCGFDWRTNVALLSGFAAKELIISTLGTAYSLGRSKKGEDVPLSEQLAADPGWNPVRALALIVFIMLYAPCLATVTCIIKEAGAWKWGVFSMVFNTSVAFLAAMLVYQGGRWVGIGV